MTQPETPLDARGWPIEEAPTRTTWEDTKRCRWCGYDSGDPDETECPVLDCQLDGGERELVGLCAECKGLGYVSIGPNESERCGPCDGSGCREES